MTGLQPLRGDHAAEALANHPRTPKRLSQERLSYYWTARNRATNFRPLTPQQMPSLHVGLVLMAATRRRQNNRVDGCSYHDRGWDDVPDVFWNDVGGQKIELRTRVRTGPDVWPHFARVSSALPAHGRFHLHPQEPALCFHDEVISRRISPGLGNCQPVSCRLGHKLCFRPLAPLLRILDYHRLLFIWAPNKKRGPQAAPFLFSTISSISICNTQMGHHSSIYISNRCNQISPKA